MNEKFTIVLCDKKVRNYFGAHPELGKPVPGAALIKTECGIHEVFGQTKPNPITVAPTMSLRRLKRYDGVLGLWEVTVNPELKNLTTNFLLLRCG